jgi:hypothetical protein
MKKTFLISLAAALLPLVAGAQVVITSAGQTYSQDFDWTTGGTQSSKTWTDNSATQSVDNWVGNSTGWYSETSNFEVANGVQVGGDTLRNFFFTTDRPDRILGGRPTGGGGPIIIGLRLTNNTGADIGSFDLSYELEVAGTRTLVTTRQVHSVVEYFSGTPSNWITDTFTSVAGLQIDFAPTVYTETEGTFKVVNNPDDPNPGNYISSAGVTDQTLTWANGQDLWIRWTLTGDNSDFNVGLDNVSFTAVPEPATYALLSGLAVLGLIALRRRRRD